MKEERGSRTAERVAERRAAHQLLDAAFVSWLGVVPYLELDAIRDVLAFVAALPAGTTIVFDYGIPPSSLSARGRAVFEWMAQRVAAAGEPWKTFFATEELTALLREVGFDDVVSFGPRDLNARYFDGRADGLRLGEMSHMVMATVVSSREQRRGSGSKPQIASMM